jgi:hypothetical protein
VSESAPPEFDDEDEATAARPFRNKDEGPVSSYNSPFPPPFRMVNERPSFSEDKGDGVSRLRVVLVGVVEMLVIVEILVIVVAPATPPPPPPPVRVAVLEDMC